MTWNETDRRHLERAAEVARTVPDDIGLAPYLHEHWYAVGQQGSDALPAWAPPLSSTFRAAHAGGRSWTGPTAVYAAGMAGTAVLEVEGSRRVVDRGDYVTVGPGAGLAPRAGTELSTSRRHGCQVHDRWWRTWNEPWDPARTPVDVSRIYLAPRLEKAASLVAAVTGLLLDADFAWCLRMGAEPETVSRADGAVLFVPDNAVARLLEPLVNRCNGLLSAQTPALTVPLAPGVAWAQDPGTGASHGELVCDLVTEAWMVRRRDESLPDVASRVFFAHRRDPRMPGLRPRTPGRTS